MNGLTLSPEALGAVQQFRTFYRDLFEIKQCIEAQRWHDLAASPSPDSVLLPEGEPARAIFARLYRAIASQSFGLRGRDRGNGAPVDVGYVMAAAADEALLHGPGWPGQESWSATLLEEALYGSKIAGERIFRTAHDLTAGHLSRPAVAVSILLALMLGFRGRYHGTDDRGEIAALKERLFGVTFHLPYPAHIDFPTLLSNAATRPLNQTSLRTLPSLRPWLVATLLLLTAYIVLSDQLWRGAVSPILATSERIIHTSAGLPQ
jgi:type VI secretion system protein ImpK